MLVASTEQQAANLLWDKTLIRNFMLQKMLKDIQAECYRKNPSVLRQISPSDIVGFKDHAFDRELKEKVPILHSVLNEAVISTKAKNRLKKNDTNYMGSSGRTPTVCLAASLLLRKRCTAMSAIAYRMSTMLWHGGVKTQVYFYFLPSHIYRTFCNAHFVLCFSNHVPYVS